MLKQAARLRQLTEGVLLAGRLDRGEVELSRDTVDLAELVQAAAAAARSQRDSPQIDVEPTDPCLITGDADRIEQILLNLLDNASKYGRPPVVVQLTRTYGRVCLAVTDAGPGIPAEDQERIFEKFYRSGPSLTRPSSGTGLGLYIARELAERMDGRLDLRSRPGHGTTFTLELPPG